MALIIFIFYFNKKNLLFLFYKSNTPSLTCIPYEAGEKNHEVQDSVPALEGNEWKVEMYLISLSMCYLSK